MPAAPPDERNQVDVWRFLFPADDRPSLAGEDFAEYLSHVPGCMVSLGVKRPGTKSTEVHTSRFDIDEGALLIGARLLARTLLHWPADLG